MHFCQRRAQQPSKGRRFRAAKGGGKGGAAAGSGLETCRRPARQAPAEMEAAAPQNLDDAAGPVSSFSEAALYICFTVSGVHSE